MSHVTDLTTGNLQKKLFAFTIPFMLSTLLQSLYGSVDLLIVGRFTDAAQVSAVSTGSQIMTIMCSIIIAFSTGGTVLIGHYYGAKEMQQAARAMGTIVLSYAAAATLLCGLVLAFVNPLMNLMHIPDEARMAGIAYLTTCACGIPFIMGYNTVSCVFRALGDSNTPLKLVVVSCIVNVAADLWLVGGLGMGAFGAALATVLAQLLCFVCALLLLRRKGLPFACRKEHLRVERSKLRTLLAIGLPIAIQDSLVMLSFAMITSLLNRWGVACSAAGGIVDRITNFTMLPSVAFGQSVAAMTAQNIGANEWKRAKATMKWGALFALGIGVICVLLVQMFPTFFCSLFTKDPEVVGYAALYLRTMSLDSLLVSFIFTFNGFYTACGHAVFSMLHNLATTFLVRLPIAYLVNQSSWGTMLHMGMAAPISSLISLIVCILYWRMGRWNMTREGSVRHAD